MIHRVEGFTIKTPELLGHDEVTQYVPLSEVVVRSRNDCEEVAQTLKLALPGARSLVVIICEPKRVQNQNTRR